MKITLSDSRLQKNIVELSLPSVQGRVDCSVVRVLKQYCLTSGGLWKENFDCRQQHPTLSCWQ